MSGSREDAWGRQQTRRRVGLLREDGSMSRSGKRVLPDLGRTDRGSDGITHGSLLPFGGDRSAFPARTSFFLGPVAGTLSTPGAGRKQGKMIKRTGTEGPKRWFCSKYGVTMFAEQAEAFCALRYRAAHQEDSCRISFSLCRDCRRGAAASKLAGGKDSAARPRRFGDIQA